MSHHAEMRAYGFRLQHTYPQWDSNDGEDSRLIWTGNMRIVHAQRARKLRRRGVPLMLAEHTKTGRARYCWFVESPYHEHQ